MSNHRIKYELFQGWTTFLQGARWASTRIFYFILFFFCQSIKIFVLANNDKQEKGPFQQTRVFFHWGETGENQLTPTHLALVLFLFFFFLFFFFTRATPPPHPEILRFVQENLKQVTVLYQCWHHLGLKTGHNFGIDRTLPTLGLGLWLGLGLGLELGLQLGLGLGCEVYSNVTPNPKTVSEKALFLYSKVTPKTVSEKALFHA